ncbi:hypothetical protein [Streptomyces amakusaensis]|uniref:Integral membrane protein n=1 Tax=Streptomyces amakusaensis TaxID=67271 RepID=A0ABW0AL65_9ACTN
MGRTGCSRPWRWEPRDVAVGAGASAVQLAVALTACFIVETVTEDDYGVPPSAFGFLCLLVVAPLIVPVAGLLFAIALPVPVRAVAAWAVRRAGGPSPRRALLLPAAFAAAFAALWAVPLALLGAGYLTAWAWLTAGTVPPLLAMARYRRAEAARETPYTRLGIWFHAFGATVLLVPATVGALALATMGGVIEEYEPPRLTAGRLAGEWEGPDEALIRLDADGSAALIDAPMGPEGEGCQGVGEWSIDEEEYGHRDAVRVTGCGDEQFWLIAGTDPRPELSVLVGDPDVGDVRIFLPRTP